MQANNPKPVQYSDPYCTDCNKHKVWIEIVLVDELNRPVAGMPYTLTVSGGQTRTGTTDANGLLREESLPPTAVTLKTDAQKLTSEMEDRGLRAKRGEKNSDVKIQATSDGHGYRYVVVGELCDKAPDIKNWNKEAFGLPRYHFKSETEFTGIRFAGSDFNRRHIIEVCPFRAWSLILNHTKTYDLVNAYNLGFLSLLSYQDEIMVDPDEPDIDMRPFIGVENTVTAFFYNSCFDLSVIPSFVDGERFYGIVTDLPFRDRYRPAIFLDSSQSENQEFFEHDTQMFFVENSTQIIAAWRGTAGGRDVITDLSCRAVPYAPVKGGKAHYGFLNAYQCMAKYFLEKLGKINRSAGDKELFICGHSLGGTAALLHAAELQERSPVTYTYGMPRVFSKTAVTELSNLTHFRHVNDADSVTSVPFDTNMDNWFFELFGPLGSILGSVWILGTSPTVPLQKMLPDFGEVYWHHGETVSFFQARQIGEAYLPVGKGSATARARWRFDSKYKFYLVPSIRSDVNDDLKHRQEHLISTIDRNILNDVFPRHNNPDIDSIFTDPSDHSMITQYLSLISNQVLKLVDKKKTPVSVKQKAEFIRRTYQDDAYMPNVERNNTFIKLENILEDVFTEQHKNTDSQAALTRFAEKTHEFTK